MTTTRKRPSKTDLTRVLSVDDILAIDDLPVETIYVREWGGAVKLRGLTKREELEVREAATDAKGNVDDRRLEVGMLIAGVQEPKFTFDQIDALMDKGSGPVTRLIRDVMVRSGMLTAIGTSAIAAMETNFREGLDTEVPVPTGAGSGDDGREPSASDNSA